MLSCSQLILLMVVSLSTVLLTSGQLVIGRNKTRQEKIFSVFSIVQFPNNGCTSTSATFSNGTCFTAQECSAKGGSAQGNCAAGFGVCCVFFRSATGSIVSENCSYVVNPGFPSNYATATSLSYTITKASTDVCRIRLDYELFVLTDPLAAAGTQGQCSTDSMTMTTSAETVTTTTTTYGPYPYLCGTNTGYHSYIDLSCTTTDSATLAFTLGDTTNNQWKIKVTQYSCNDDYVACQAGCFQYHTGVTGTIQSYNFAGAAQIQGQNYKNCIRQEVGYCCIQYTVNTYAISVTTCADATDNRCSGASVCTNDYILIPNTISSGIVNYDRFCGVNLNSVGTPAINVPIITCDLPFEVSHITGVESVGGPAAVVAEDGFSINYSQIAGNC